MIIFGDPDSKGKKEGPKPLRLSPILRVLENPCLGERPLIDHDGRASVAADGTLETARIGRTRGRIDIGVGLQSQVGISDDTGQIVLEGHFDHSFDRRVSRDGSGEVQITKVMKPRRKRTKAAPAAPRKSAVAARGTRMVPTKIWRSNSKMNFLVGMIRFL